jgi:Zn-dependent protease
MSILFFILIVLIFLFSIVFHEVSHGWVAYALGDPTAKYEGRLTLNPLKHLDPIGSVLLPGVLILTSIAFGGGIIFGWAKPVPINPYNFRDQKYGQAKVALAGPLANIVLALVFGLSLRFLPFLSSLPNIFLVFSYIVQINILLAIFNLLPIPPLDGSHILFTFLPPSYQEFRIVLAQYGFLVLLFIILFLFKPIISFVNWLSGFIIGLNLG